MAQKPIPVAEYVRRVLTKIYDVCDAELFQTSPDVRVQNIVSIGRQLGGRVPPWFLEKFLETTRNPERDVEAAVQAFRETVQPFNSKTMPADSLKNCILGGVVPQVIHALMEQIFGPVVILDPSQPPYLKFTVENEELYAFLVRRTVEDDLQRGEQEGDDRSASEGGSLTTETGLDDESREINFVLTDEDTTLLVQAGTNNIFSVTRLIKRLKQSSSDRGPTRSGQYL